jgi:hypothetical protein
MANSDRSLESRDTLPEPSDMQTRLPGVLRVMAAAVSRTWTQLGHKTHVVDTEFAETARMKSNRISSLMVGERGFEPPTPWSRTERRSNPKCFNWCRLGAETPNFLSPSIVLLVPSRFGSFQLKINGLHRRLLSVPYWRPPPEGVNANYAMLG